VTADPNVSAALRALEALTVEQRGLVFCWFCDGCYAYVGPGDTHRCEHGSAVWPHAVPPREAMKPEQRAEFAQLKADVADLRSRVEALMSGEEPWLPPTGRYSFDVIDVGGRWQAIAVDEGDTTDRREGKLRATKWAAIIDAWSIALALEMETSASLREQLREADGDIPF
jgi:hypothetical protein